MWQLIYVFIDFTSSSGFCCLSFSFYFQGTVTIPKSSNKCHNQQPPAFHVPTKYSSRFGYCFNETWWGGTIRIPKMHTFLAHWNAFGLRTVGTWTCRDFGVDALKPEKAAWITMWWFQGTGEIVWFPPRAVLGVAPPPCASGSLHIKDDSWCWQPLNWEMKLVNDY